MWDDHDFVHGFLPLQSKNWSSSELRNANCCRSNRYNKARVLTLSGKSSAFYLTVARMSSKDPDWAEFDIAIWLNDEHSGRFRMICSTLHWLQINHLYSVPKSAFTCPSPQCDRYRSLQELCWLLWHEFPMMNVKIDIFLRPSAGLDNSIRAFATSQIALYSFVNGF